MDKYTCIDLFAGAGGLSEGFMQAGSFKFLAHVEWEKPMVDTLRNSLMMRWGYSEIEAKNCVFRFDIQKTDELLHGNWTDATIQEFQTDNPAIFFKKGLDGIIKDQPVDVIIGGPPCQAYSIAGRAQDPLSMKEDYRNFLFESFVKVVEYYRPKIFVFENVPGILSASPGDKLVIERICTAFENIGYETRQPNEMKKSIYSSVDFAVPQDRNRVIIIGVNKDTKFSVEDFYRSLDRHKLNKPIKTVREAIAGLPKYKPLENPTKEAGRNISHELIGETNVPNHKARYHNKRDIMIFKEWLQNNMNEAPTRDKLAFYNKVTGKVTNHNKYRSLDWDKPAPTVVSHLYKDGLMFIHPDREQLRSITVREAALLQTFPMDFEFIGSDSYCFKMIGNAVPVLFAKSIAESIISVLEKNEK